MDSNKKNIVFLTVFLGNIFLFPINDVMAQLNTGNLTQLTEKDGLSSNTVNTVLVDKMGYVWISTYNGLVRYDGYNFDKFYSNPNDSSAIQGMISFETYEDRNGHIWIGTNPGFINEYNPDTKFFDYVDYTGLIRTRSKEEPLYGYIVNAFCEDNKGNLYIGVSTNSHEVLESGLLIKPVKENEIRLMKESEKLGIQDIFIIERDSEGSIWFIARTGLYHIDSLGTMTIQNDLLLELPLASNEYFIDMKFKTDGNVLFLTRLGKLIDMDLKSGVFTVYYPAYGIKKNSFRTTTLAYLEDAEIWIGSNEGAFLFNIITNSTKAFTTGINKDLSNAVITDIKEDGMGGIFFGTQNKGILRYEDKPIFTSFTNDAEDGLLGLLPGWINVIYETDDGMIWTNSNGGINTLDLKSGKVVKGYSSQEYPMLGYGSALWQDQDQYLWISHGWNLFRFRSDLSEIKQFNLPGFPDRASVNKFFLDSKGNEWIASSAGLFYKENSKQNFTEIKVHQNTESNVLIKDISNLIESEKFGLWIITNEGLYNYDYETGLVNRHGDGVKGESFMSQDINSLYESDDGNIWVGQWQGGLAKYDPTTRKLKTYNLDDGLPSMCIQSIIGDEKNGTIWLSTFNGLSRFNPTTEQFNNYSLEDGIQSSLFADGSYLKTSDGHFIFGGANGITVFDPDDFNIEYDPPKVILTDLKLSNKSIIPGPESVLQHPIYKTEKLILKHNQNNLTLNFLAFNYANPEKVKYAYILENFEDDWIETINQRQAIYSNLPPGKYTFKVKAANEKGVWNETETMLNITINPPWWRSYWAYALYTALLALFVWWAHKFQKERTIRIERDKSREKELAQAREIEKAYQNLKVTQAQLIQAEKMASLGELTAGIAHEIQNPLNFVNNFAQINVEIIDEVNEEIVKGDITEVKALLQDVKNNEEKIVHHGKRADSIVKGMLQHSRMSTGENVLTDLNQLTEEYLRLAYHGLRAKNSNFNATFKTDLDPDLPKIKVIPQDVGRVLLNLINNAFQAVYEKSKSGIAGYMPNVVVSTKLNSTKMDGSDTVTITVQDNGPGIPNNIKSKIFQPFFTTKPSGQGTGLGLSLSYDIVKAHGGDIKIESQAGKGSTFSIIIPR